MKTKLLNVPLPLWGILCLILAMVWVVVWPREKAAATDEVRYLILRWFHALTWLLLAIAAFLAAYNWLGGAATARVVALLSLVAYLLFLGTFVMAR